MADSSDNTEKDAELTELVDLCLQRGGDKLEVEGHRDAYKMYLDALKEFTDKAVAVYEYITEAMSDLDREDDWQGSRFITEAVGLKRPELKTFFLAANTSKEELAKEAENLKKRSKRED
jgi:hypothetical protein